MDGPMSFCPRYFVFTLLSLLLVVEKSKALSIKLIHPFSSESPFYEPNITFSKLIKRFSPRSRPRQTSISLNSSKTVRSRTVLEYSYMGHLAKLDLGTFPGQNPTHKTYYFIFDTGSHFTWLQCEDCAKPGNECFRQHYPPYPDSKSSTYTPLIYGRNHPLCYSNQYIDQHCSYQLDYDDDSYSIGIIANETFTFDSTHTLRVIMGCGIRNKITISDKDFKISGLLGMSWGPHSFVNQIQTISHGRFSYCLPPVIGHLHYSSVLRFGSDTPPLHGLRRLPIQQYSREGPYYIKLQGMSINSQRVDIPPSIFTKTEDGGGCKLDTGTPLTHLLEDAYDILKEEMIEYLGRVDASLTMMTSRGAFDLCFKRNPPFKGHAHLPRMTFHFEGGVNLVLKPHIAFSVVLRAGKEIVCMMIMPNIYNNDVVIGSQSQANHVFVFDLPSKNVYFGPRDCTRNN